MTILSQIKDHYTNKKYTKITRQVAENHTEFSRGYIVGYSKDFIILQETDDFRLCGYLAIPVAHIVEVRYDKNDKFYDKIMILEKEIDNVSLPHKIDLSNWQTLFKSIKGTGLNVIVECEDPEIDTFIIGLIVKTTKKLVYILYFSATGIIDEEPTSIDYNSITKVMFDDRYINVISKYVRNRRKKTIK